MTNLRKNKCIKKVVVIAATFALALTTCTAVFAEEGVPQANSNRENGTLNQICGGLNDNMTPPEKPNGETNQNEFNKNQTGEIPNELRENNEEFNEMRSDMVPPEDANATPNENVPAKPENENTNNIPSEAPTELKGIDLMAVESYIKEAGEDANEEVCNAYNALTQALKQDSSEQEDVDISELEEALTSALQEASVSLEDYKNAPELPEDFDASQSGISENEPPEEVDTTVGFKPFQYVKQALEKILEKLGIDA